VTRKDEESESKKGNSEEGGNLGSIVEEADLVDEEGVGVRKEGKGKASTESEASWEVEPEDEFGEDERPLPETIQPD
jgi:hypothetical protein